MALKCTNTSGPPPSWEMKPKPFSELNHLTVPVAIRDPLLSWPGSTSGSHRSRPGSDEPEGNHLMQLPSPGTVADRGRLPGPPSMGAALRSGRRRALQVIGSAAPNPFRVGTSTLRPTGLVCVDLVDLGKTAPRSSSDDIETN